ACRQSTETRRLTERLRAAVYGHLVGDALGVPYEFTSPAVGSVVWRGGGKHGQPPGTWSDDGALMLATLDSLLSAGFDTADQAQRFLAWYPGGAYTPDPGERPFDIGKTTRHALDRLRAGTPAGEAGDGPTGLGNGSLMRILPIALVDPTAEPAQLVERAHRSSRITHAAPECLAACALYLLVARELLAGERDRPSALERAIGLLRAEYGRIGQGELVEALDALLAWSGRAGRGHVLDSFWSAWDAFAGSRDYASAVIRAVEYGRDTDTTAAIAGGLAGLYWGEGTIPAEWLAGLRGKELVEEILGKAGV
ncbi:MAG: ADP-ribosylglycohydrolase family protein, partial [Gemmatimonadales bacterium]